MGESLIVDSGNGRLSALIFPDLENINNQGITPEELSGIMDENLRTLNAQLPAYSQVSGYRLREEEFEKTPKRSIKRYLYKA